ncbi:IS110 family transposase [Candidatus Auribacterota bacterium]
MKYIGMDAHSSTCTFSVMDKDGVELDNRTIETNGRLLIKYTRRIEGTKKLAFEECELSNWLYTLLKNEVDDLIVCNPVANTRYKEAKNDKLDARQLANLLRGGFMKAVYHDGSARERFRSLMSGYQDLIEEAIRLKCRYKSLFRKEGIRANGGTLYSDESLLDNFKRSDFKFIGERTYLMLEKMEEERQKYVEEIRKENKKFKEIKVLKTLPGIGDIQAAKIVSQVIDPKRFKSKYKYNAYCGLAKHQKKSGGKDYGSTKIHGNRILKCVYKMAGHSALKGTSGLRKYYDQKRSEGISHYNAYNAVCRMIAAMSLSVWKNNKIYDDKEFIKNHLN